jgi:hypothetical protein
LSYFLRRLTSLFQVGHVALNDLPGAASGWREHIESDTSRPALPTLYDVTADVAAAADTMIFTGTSGCFVYDGPIKQAERLYGGKIVYSTECGA